MPFVENALGTDRSALVHRTLMERFAIGAVIGNGHDDDAAGPDDPTGGYVPPPGY